MIPFIWTVQNKQIRRDRSRLVVARGWGKESIGCGWGTGVLCGLMETLWDCIVVTVAQLCEYSRITELHT